MCTAVIATPSRGCPGRTQQGSEVNSQQSTVNRAALFVFKANKNHFTYKNTNLAEATFLKTHAISTMYRFPARPALAKSLNRVLLGSNIQTRQLSIHEYMSMGLLNEYGIPTPISKAAKTPEEAHKIAESFGQCH
ncbi:unnamed protein product [Medioppia subpectinata]|uniref:Uncharacterized protein n=1 Tax=Medioppia subpectinata TaxID=1979941 RepID=A0A7R9KJ81_9ACAR|nr:unnamed protein product [Medioppia subpectinata]CAG2104515.1 unnamed protein product [Medioppia subpectinata]